MKHALPLLALASLWVLPAHAQPKPAPDPAAEFARVSKLADTLKPKGGTIMLGDGVAKIVVPDQFRYLDPKETNTVLVDIWGNPKGDEPLGMIVPTGFSPLNGKSWVVVVTYAADGFVKDDDAKSMDFSKLLTQMKEGTAAASKEREKQGYAPVELIGWATPPHYDAATHKLYWAKEVHFGGRKTNTLNYNIRMLGRRGVLVLNAVANMRQLDAVEKATPAILETVNFQDGHRYADFDSSTDKVATYGIAALVLGGIAAKAGIFKLILVGILAAKKFIVLAAIAVGGYLKRLFGRKKTPPNPASSLIPPSS
jgi:uncharacterized membrane-anchored protein